MTTSFVRALGAESGVQLNPLRDNSDVPANGNGDQSFGVIMRATRGRIDAPFVVDRSNINRLLGPGESVRASQLNEAWAQVHEALNNGAYQAVVQRLVTSDAQIKWLVAEVDDTTHEVTFAVENAEPTADFLLAIKHLNCHNDGIKAELRADETKTGGVAQNNDRVTLRLLDKDGVLLHEFSGSLKADARDDFGASAYLPDVAAAQTDLVEIKIGVTGAAAAIHTASNAYGYDATTGAQKWARSAVLVCFVEGSTTYAASDYIAAREKLARAPFEYAYLISGGSRATALLTQLTILSNDTNRHLRYDIPGELGVTAAIAFAEQLNLDSHLIHGFWAPFKSDDPSGVNPNGYLGTAALNVAYSCRRNAGRNARGFAPKNYPVAGKEWPVRRSGIRQTAFPTGQELSALARAKINPVIYEVYSGGGRFAFLDSLTSARVDSSLKKLISVAEMSTDIDDQVTRAGKDFLQLPMDISIKRMRDFLTSTFESAQASGWLVPSSAPQMDGRAWAFEVLPNAQRPYDQMDVRYWLRYDGVARQIFVTQTLTR